MSNAVAEPSVVLVVEDDLLLRMDAADIVRNAGFDVFEAGSADEAIAVLEANQNVHLVFTDIHAGVDGWPQAGEIFEGPLAPN